MVTRSRTPVGASNSNPNTATPGAVGQEVTAPVAVTPVPAGGSSLVTGTAVDAGLVAAAKTFREALGLLRIAFELHLRTIPTGDPRRKGALNARRAAVIPLLAELQREHPGLATVNPDDILARLSGGQAMLLVVRDLQALLTDVEDTQRLEMVDAWTGAGTVYAAARHRAKTDKSLAVKLAPVRDALRTGSRTDTAVVTTAVAGHVATKAQTRAARAQQRAQAAGQSQSRAVQAHAASHPALGTPVPAAVSQGPAVTTPADAASNQGPAVNPQGPAPGR